jgi:acetyl-CoA carboxylase carboxyl transferase subunit alpha
MVDKGSFLELHGDRNFADDPAMIGGLATLDGQKVMIIGTQKGRTTKKDSTEDSECRILKDTEKL